MNVVFENVLLAAGIIFACAYIFSICVLLHHELFEKHIVP